MPNRCYCCLLSGSCFEHPMLMAREAAHLRPQGDVSCAEAPHPPVPWRSEQNDRVLAPVVRDLQWFPCGNGTVLNDPPLVYGLLLRWHIQGRCLCIQIAQSQSGVTALVACRTSGANGGKRTAACGCNTGALIPTLPPSSSSAFGVNSLPSASSSKLPVHRSPGTVPINTVFDPSIGPKYLPCSNREPRGPRRRLDGCKGIHHTRSPNCTKRRTARLPTFRSCAVLPSRPTANRRCVLAAYGTSHVKRSWSVGTSALEADSTASLIDLTCPLTTFTELSAAPLDCGSADVSCTTSPLQANVTTRSNARMEAHCRIETPLCGDPKCPHLLRSSSPPSRNLGNRLLLRESSEQKLTW